MFWKGEGFKIRLLSLCRSSAKVRKKATTLKVVKAGLPISGPAEWWKPTSGMEGLSKQRVF